MEGSVDLGYPAMHGRELTSISLDGKSDALTTTSPSHPTCKPWLRNCMSNLRSCCWCIQPAKDKALLVGGQLWRRSWFFHFWGHILECFVGAYVLPSNFTEAEPKRSHWTSRHLSDGQYNLLSEIYIVYTRPNQGSYILLRVYIPWY